MSFIPYNIYIFYDYVFRFTLYFFSVKKVIIGNREEKEMLKLEIRILKFVE